MNDVEGWRALVPKSLHWNHPSAVAAVPVTFAGRHWGWLPWHHCGTLLMHGQVFTPDPWKHNLSIPIHLFPAVEASPHSGSQCPLTSTTTTGTSAAALIYSDGEMKAQCSYKSSPFSARLPNNGSSYLDWIPAILQTWGWADLVSPHLPAQVFRWEARSL